MAVARLHELPAVGLNVFSNRPGWVRFRTPSSVHCSVIDFKEGAGPEKSICGLLPRRNIARMALIKINAFAAKLSTLIKLAKQIKMADDVRTRFVNDRRDYFKIFFRKRSTDGYTVEFAAYDDMIYLAKSHISMLFECSVSDGIKEICKHMGIEAAGDMPSIPTKVSFFADDKSCTEAIRMLLDKAKADTAVGKEYNALCINGAVTCIPKGEMIEDYVATDKTNVVSSEHSESIEDMVNRVVMVDEKGSVCQTFTNTDDQTHYGTLEKIYKVKPPKKDESVDNVAAAKAMLSRTKEESSLQGLGYIQCIAGYTIKVQEENLKGNFFIKADSQSWTNRKSQR